MDKTTRFAIAMPLLSIALGALIYLMGWNPWLFPVGVLLLVVTLGGILQITASTIRDGFVASAITVAAGVVFYWMNWSVAVYMVLCLIGLSIIASRRQRHKTNGA